jgi:acetyl-CoA C-acetyltransferase
MMGRVPMGSDGFPMAVDPALAFAGHFVPQGIAADLIATEFGFSRTDVDAYAVESQRRAAVAVAEGRLARSIVPVRDRNGIAILEADEHPRPGTDMQALGALKPAFRDLGETMPGFDAVAILKYPHLERIEHVHHAGNSSGIVDGAAAVLVGSREAGQRLGLRPRARIRATARVGTDPTIMLTGPVPATEKALKAAGMGIGDIDLVEVNEAFSSIVLRFLQAFDADPAIGQRERRRDRLRPSARRDRGDDPRHAPRRAGAHRQGHRPRDALRASGMGAATIIERV